MSSGDNRDYKELLIGCGMDRAKRIQVKYPEWQHLTTMDRNPRCEPDLLHDLTEYPWPISDDSFDEIHGYEVCEHVTGRQGEEKPFFQFFSEAWRVLKPNGIFAGTVPRFDSIQAFGDPSHSRVINEVTLWFLSQQSYIEGVGSFAISDFRAIYRADFEILATTRMGDSLVFELKAMKPARGA